MIATLGSILMSRVRHTLFERFLLRQVWWAVSPALVRLPYVQHVSRAVHRGVCVRQGRTPSALYTRFLRNPPQLRVLRKIILQEGWPSVKLAVLGCSTGAELYSALWTIRTARPETNVSAVGLDVSPSAIAQAQAGIYLADSEALRGVPEDVIEKLFLRSGSRLEVREEYRRGVSWVATSACIPGLATRLGSQDIVFANNFLTHLTETMAESCLACILSLVRPGGYLFVWGVDLDVKTTVLCRFGLTPVLTLLEEVHRADVTARRLWPWKYWGLEPLDTTRPDWQFRYATVYRAPRLAPNSSCGGLAGAAAQPLGDARARTADSLDRGQMSGAA